MKKAHVLLAGSTLWLMAAPASAEELAAPTQREMMDLIRAQADRIRVLEARLDEIASRDRPGADVQAPGEAISQPVPARTAAAPAATRKWPAPEPEMHVEWDDGAPNFALNDQTFSFRPRGRIMLDLGTTAGSRYSRRNITTTGARAARIGLEGTFFQHGFYTFDVEFGEPSATEILSAFIGYQGRAGKLDYDIRLGNMFNDRSLEGQTGSQNTPLLERNFVAGAIMPRRAFYGMGTMARVFGPGWHASVTVAGDPIDGDVATSDSLSISSRIHWNPVRTQGDVIHLGLWGFREWLRGSGRTVTRNTLVGARFDTNLRASTGPLVDADTTTGYGAELAWAHKEVYVWAEYGRRDLTFLAGAPTPDFSIDAWSVAGGWFLTGENAPYSARQGNFQPVKIDKSLADGGSGAIEVVARHQRLDNSRTPLGGRATETTLGLNWYPVPLLRFMINWTHWNVNNRIAPFDGADNGDSITARAQIVF